MTGLTVEVRKATDLTADASVDPHDVAGNTSSDAATSIDLDPAIFGVTPNIAVRSRSSRKGPGELGRARSALRSLPAAVSPSGPSRAATSSGRPER